MALAHYEQSECSDDLICVCVVYGQDYFMRDHSFIINFDSQKEEVSLQELRELVEELVKEKKEICNKLHKICGCERCELWQYKYRNINKYIQYLKYIWHKHTSRYFKEQYEKTLTKLESTEKALEEKRT